ncbi:S1C family serine protease [Elongatibacter sediminis]|uniref:Trypsin-like peptidase domain-containing protein n=1 Tax=Elongatibacter sediminis TaxID=3119006 RepID=A0AAW9R824_9GAMM
MKNAKEILGFLFRALVAGLALAFVAVYLWPAITEPEAADAAPVENPAAQANGGELSGPFSYADAVDRAAPAVVSIYTMSLEPQGLPPSIERETGRRFLYRMRRDMGSGVLISEDGYILTNHHVISKAQNIRVALWDGRLAGAQVVGSDLETDLAVLKVNLTGLPTAPIGEDTSPRVGDVVLAIGNALGLSHTVTLGIISATGRETAGSSVYEGFLQTDAAINAGNSGGALVNARGELIGINTRNLSGVTGAQNIGFAIPIATARAVMRQIIEYGSVRRGWLGALFSDLPPTTAADGSSVLRGIFVRDVTRSGPAWEAGIRDGDQIVTLNGEPVEDVASFNLEIASTAPGTQVELEVRRRGEEFQTYATLIQQPPMR